MKNTAKMIDAFFQKPLMIEDAAFRMLLAAMNVAASFPVPALAYGSGRNGNVVTIKSEIAVIPILGVLTYRSDYWSYMFDETSYQDIRRNFRQALGDATVSAIVLDVGSPGGTSEGCFDLVDEIFEARSVKPIYAIVNEAAYSGGYAIASAAGKVFIPRTGSAGSIGVKAVHIDQSAAEEQAGFKYTEIFAGARKIDGTPHAPLTEEARAVYQKVVDQVNDLFIETVARNRNLKPADVRAQQAAIYHGKEAVAAGLADSVLSWDGAWKKIIGIKSNTGGTSMKTKLQALFEGAAKADIIQALGELGYVPKMEGAVVLTAAHLPAVASALGIEAAQLSGDLAKVDFSKLGAASLSAAVTEAKASTKKETLSYAQELLALCELGGKLDLAPALLKDEAKIEDVRSKVMASKAAPGAGGEIRSTLGALGGEAPNPLLADAKKRAGEKK